MDTTETEDNFKGDTKEAQDSDNESCHSDASTATIPVKFRDMSISIEDELEIQKNHNLANLNVEMLFRHIESKLNNKNLQEDETNCSWFILIAFLQKPTTHAALSQEILRIQQNDYLLENDNLDDLMDSILNFLKKLMQAEYDRRKRVWEGCLKILT